MQSDLGKLFIGGISWDTNEEHLTEYFSTYGEVLEAVIMKDRTTGRARGFGFIVFADPVVADRVVKEKHNIDGRLVEAKKAVPKDDHSSTMSRNSGSIQGSPGPVRTRKIFVGGLASTVTESDFRSYFEQFGTIMDVVVMYDHNTQRPRGFGFITYESEVSVDNVLVRTFHELNGKMVEVKRAVPKDLSPSPTRSPLGGYNYGVTRLNSVLNGYNQGYSLNAVGGLGVRMDGRFSPVPVGRSGFAPFGSGYGMGLNFELGMNSNYGGNANLNSSIGYGRGMDPYYNSNRVNNPVGFDGGNTGNNSSFFSSPTRNMWGNGVINHGINSTNSGGYVGAGTGIIGARNSGNSGLNWGSSPNSPRGGGNVSNQGGILGYGGVDRSYNLGAGPYGRNSATNVPPSSFSTPNGNYDATFGDTYASGPVYGDSSWRSANSEQEEFGAFGYGLGDRTTDIHVKTSPRYAGGYGVSTRQTNRGLTG